MHRQFNELKQKYDFFERFLLKNGRFPALDTGIGYWGVTPLDSIFDVLKKLKLKKKRSFIDLGSGDGRVVLLASLFGVKAVGLELYPWLIETSIKIKNSLKHPKFENAVFREQDFMEHDLRDYGVVYVSPDKPFHRGLEQKLKNELTGTLIVHGFEFHPRGFKKLKEFVVNGEKFGVYQQ